MTVTALSSTNVERVLGAVWTLSVLVTDADCVATDAATPVVTVTLPAGTTATPAVERLAAGVYRSTYEVGTAGRYIARAVAAGYGAATFAAFVTATTAATAMPDVDDVDDYLGGATEHSWSDAQLGDALAAEEAAQRRVCRVPAEYPADMREALLRRVAVNLAKRKLPLMVLQGDADAGTASGNVPANDSEVRRLERPWRKLVIG
jgi:hypothetical protein